MLRTLPALDSDELSRSLRRHLLIPRHVGAELGRSALQATASGHYRSDSGAEVDWSGLVDDAIAAKVTIPPHAPLHRSESVPFPETRVRVTNETTLEASKRWVDGGLRPLALNFANGVHPGGGFLSGARAQEEALCRSSALHATLVGDPMYDAHARRERPDCTDWAIYSPHVPVFRRDDGSALENPWLLCFLTCAAPYAPAIGQPDSRDLLRQRISRVLAIARAYGHPSLVLGAWGCGAFGNDPTLTAQDFRHALEGEFEGAFSDVVFAVADWSPERRYLGPFRDVFSAG